MVDMTLNDLCAMVKVTHFGTNRFLICDFLCQMSIVTFALGRTVSLQYTIHMLQTDDRRTQHCSVISATVSTVG